MWWTRRWLLIDFVGRELRSRYVGSIAGALWIFLHPLVLLALYAMVFQAIFRVRLPEMGDYPFVAFVALGLWPWLAFQEGVQRAVQAIKSNAGLVRKVAFPHELLVLAATASAFAVHLAGFALAVLVLALAGVGINWSGLPIVLAALICLFFFTLALGLCLAAIQVFVPDLEQIVGPALSILFYATPVLYPAAAVPEWLRQGMILNPVMHFVEPIRTVLLDGASGISVLVPWVWLVSLALVVPAVWLFRRLSPYFEDFL